jgi:hypothetical protein
MTWKTNLRLGHAELQSQENKYKGVTSYWCTWCNKEWEIADIVYSFPRPEFLKTLYEATPVCSRIGANLQMEYPNDN